MDDKKIKFIRMDEDNFQCLFPNIPPFSISPDVSYGLVFVPGRGWDPCVIKRNDIVGVYFQDAKTPGWRLADFTKAKYPVIEV